MNMHYANPTDAFIEMLMNIRLEGNKIFRRDQETAELTFVNMTIMNPEWRCYLLPKRNDNIFAKVMETLWVLYGRNDIKWLSVYLPRAIDYSDDGMTWRAGYGGRIRYWYHRDETMHIMTDQLAYVVNLLLKDRYSRQAIISIWDPTIDAKSGKDIPCNNWLHFMVVNEDGKDRLHLSIAQRSADIIWGWSNINIFEWSVLMQAVASWIGVEVGDMHYYISNLHLYKRHYKRSVDIIQEYTFKTMYNFGIRPAKISTPFKIFDRELNKFFYAEYAIRTGSASSLLYHSDDEFIYSAIIMAELWCSMDNNDHIYDLVNAMPKTDLRVAVIEYMMRSHGKSLLNNISLDSNERQCLDSICKHYRD